MTHSTPPHSTPPIITIPSHSPYRLASTSITLLSQPTPPATPPPHQPHSKGIAVSRAHFAYPIPRPGTKGEGKVRIISRTHGSMALALGLLGRPTDMISLDAVLSVPVAGTLNSSSADLLLAIASGQCCAWKVTTTPPASTDQGSSSHQPAVTTATLLFTTLPPIINGIPSTTPVRLLHLIPPRPGGDQSCFYAITPQSVIRVEWQKLILPGAVTTWSLKHPAITILPLPHIMSLAWEPAKSTSAQSLLLASVDGHLYRVDEQSFTLVSSPPWPLDVQCPIRSIHALPIPPSSTSTTSKSFSVILAVDQQSSFPGSEGRVSLFALAPSSSSSSSPASAPNPLQTITFSLPPSPSNQPPFSILAQDGNMLYISDSGTKSIIFAELGSYGVVRYAHFVVGEVILSLCVCQGRLFAVLDKSVVEFNLSSTVEWTQVPPPPPSTMPSVNPADIAPRSSVTTLDDQVSAVVMKQQQGLNGSPSKGQATLSVDKSLSKGGKNLKMNTPPGPHTSTPQVEDVPQKIQQSEENAPSKKSPVRELLSHPPAELEQPDADDADDDEPLSASHLLLVAAAGKEHRPPKTVAQPSPPSLPTAAVGKANLAEKSDPLPKSALHSSIIEGKSQSSVSSIFTSEDEEGRPSAVKVKHVSYSTLAPEPIVMPIVPRPTKSSPPPSITSLNSPLDDTSIFFPNNLAASFSPNGMDEECGKVDDTSVDKLPLRRVKSVTFDEPILPGAGLSSLIDSQTAATLLRKINVLQASVDAQSAEIARLANQNTLHLESKMITIMNSQMHDALFKSIVPKMENVLAAMMKQVHEALSTGVRDVLRDASAKFEVKSSKYLANTDRKLDAIMHSMKGHVSQVVFDASIQSVLAAQASTTAALLSPTTSQAGSHSGLFTPTLPHLPEAVDPRVEIGELLVTKEYDAAFSKALKAGSEAHALLLWLFGRVKVDEVLNPCILSQPVLLSLLHIASQQLDTTSASPALKLTWIQEALMHLKPADPAIVAHAKKVLAFANKKVQAFATSCTAGSGTSLVEEGVQRQVRLIGMMLSGLLL